MRNDGWELQYKDGTPVKCGDELRDGYVVSAGLGAPPHKPSSTGRVWVKTSNGMSREYFPTVFDMRWVKAEG